MYEIEDSDCGNDHVIDDETLNDADTQKDTFNWSIGNTKTLLIERTAFLWRDPVTLKLSFLRIVQTILYFLLFIFLINALIVTFAFWKAAKLTPGHVNLEEVKLVGLDEDMAHLSISGQLENTFLMNYIQFKFTKPLEVDLMLEDANKKSISCFP